ncbi:MAG: ABC transporter substrate-binding protein, partial [Leucobacter sp.]
MSTLSAFRRGAVGLTAVAALAVALTGCGTSGGGSSSGGDDNAMKTELGEMEGKVNILAWPGYVEDGSNDPDVDWVTPFVEQTGCEVNAKTFGTSDEAFNLMKTGDYDVVSASGDASLRLVASGAVSPVNTELLENYDGIYDFLKNRDWNTVDGQSYGVPHGYGANLLQYNTEEFPEAPTSWDVVFDKADEHAGKISAYDSPIYIADAAVYLMAHQPELGIENPYALDQDQFDAAVDLLKEQRPNIGEYWSDYLKLVQAFQSGDTVASTSWQVIQGVLESEGAPVAAVLPEEGSTGWSDTWMIASNAKNSNCAYAWLDYIASPEANAMATGYFGEAPSSEAACEFREDCEAYHAGDADYADQIWYWTTPIAECLDGRT